MSEQENQQRQEVPFAAAKASAARSAILRSSAELLTWRARVEIFFSMAPFLPMMMPLWESFSQ